MGPMAETDQLDEHATVLAYEKLRMTKEQTIDKSTKCSEKKKESRSKPPRTEAAQSTKPQHPTTSSDIELFDLDCNLTHPELFSHADQLLLEAAEKAGVKGMLVPGSTVEESRTAIALAARHPGRIYASAGVHPYHVLEYRSIDDVLPQLKELGEQKTVAAMGEFGLDYSPSFPPREEQIKWFEPQLRLACEIGKPLFLHERLAHKDFISILEQYQHKLPPAVVHCFTGTETELRAYVSMGFYIGVTGFLCKKEHGRQLQEMLHLIPRDRLLVETDAPYMGFPVAKAIDLINGRRPPRLPRALQLQPETAISQRPNGTSSHCGEGGDVFEPYVPGSGGSYLPQCKALHSLLIVR